MKKVFFAVCFLGLLFSSVFARAASAVVTLQVGNQEQIQLLTEKELVIKSCVYGVVNGKQASRCLVKTKTVTPQQRDAILRAMEQSHVAFNQPTQSEDYMQKSQSRSLASEFSQSAQSQSIKYAKDIPDTQINGYSERVNKLGEGRSIH